MTTPAQTSMEYTMGRGTTHTGTIPSYGQSSPPACLNLQIV